MGQRSEASPASLKLAQFLAIARNLEVLWQEHFDDSHQWSREVGSADGIENQHHIQNGGADVRTGCSGGLIVCPLCLVSYHCLFVFGSYFRTVAVILFQILSERN